MKNQKLIIKKSVVSTFKNKIISSNQKSSIGTILSLPWN